MLILHTRKALNNTMYKLTSLNNAVEEGLI